jgi:hypothetical protein
MTLPSAARAGQNPLNLPHRPPVAPVWGRTYCGVVANNATFHPFTNTTGDGSRKVCSRAITIGPKST